jgi:hypothetical protein
MRFDNRMRTACLYFGKSVNATMSINMSDDWKNIILLNNFKSNNENTTRPVRDHIL